jgi:hypothetical protein
MVLKLSLLMSHLGICLKCILLQQSLRLNFHKISNGQAPVAQDCNPSYLVGRDQEDCGSKPTRTHSSWAPLSKKPFTKKKQNKKNLVEWLKVEALSLNPSTTKKDLKWCLPLDHTWDYKASTPARRPCAGNLFFLLLNFIHLLTEDEILAFPGKLSPVCVS